MSTRKNSKLIKKKIISKTNTIPNNGDGGDNGDNGDNGYGVDSVDTKIIQSSFNASKNADKKELGTMIDNLDIKLQKEGSSMSEEERNKLSNLISKLKKEYLDTSISIANQERDLQNKNILEVKRLSEEHLLEIISLNIEPGKRLSKDPTFVCWYESKKLWIRKSKESMPVLDPSKDIFKNGNKGNKQMPKNLKKIMDMRL